MDAELAVTWQGPICKQHAPVGDTSCAYAAAAGGHTPLRQHKLNVIHDGSSARTAMALVGEAVDHRQRRGRLGIPNALLLCP